MINDLKNKVAVITGAGGGLGKCLCTYFAGLGIKIVATDIDSKSLKTLEKEIRKKGGDILTFSLDITDYEGIKEAIDKVVKKWGTIDILINNAAARILKSFDKLDKGDIDLMVDVTLKGTIYLTHLVSPVMIKAKKGYIFNISSTAGLRAINKNASIYAASKFGINGFSEAISKYLIDYNIHVVNLCPGGINTSMWKKYSYIFGNEKKKYLMEPIEVAELIEFILRKERKSTIFKNLTFFPVCEIEGS